MFFKSDLLDLRATGFLAAICLTWFYISASIDVNHPPGVRWVRWGAHLFLFILGLIEFIKPQWGLILAMFIWPHWLIGKDLLTRLYPLISYVPDYHGGAMAAVLAIAFWIRFEREHKADVNRPVHSSVLRAFTWLLWIFVFTAVASVIAFYLRSDYTGWVIEAPDVRRLSTQLHLSRLIPLIRFIDMLPPVLLGLLYLHAISLRPRHYLTSHFSIGCVFIGAILAIEVLMQILLGADTWRWPHDGHPPGGPLWDRNVVAPILVLFSTFAITIVFSLRPARDRALAAGLALLMLIAAILTGSRNGIVCALLVPVFLMLCRPTRNRIIGLSFGGFGLVGLILFAPIPEKTGAPVFVQRSIDTILALRARDWETVLTQRNYIYESSFAIFCDHPLTGTGIGTLPMLVQKTSTYNKFSQVYGLPQVHSHNAILHYLAEQGLIAGIVWCLLWLIIPFWLVIHGGKPAYFAIGALVFGMVNQLDFIVNVQGVWLLGMTLLILISQESALKQSKETSLETATL